MRYPGQSGLLFFLFLLLHFAPNNLHADHSDPDTLYIGIPDLEGQLGDTIALDFRVRNFVEVISLQFDFRFDTAAMSFVDLDFGDLEVIGFSSFGFDLLEKGSLRFGWADFSDNSYTLEDNSRLFTLKMELRQPIASLQGLISLSDEIISIEYANSSLELGAVQLVIDQLSDVTSPRSALQSMRVAPNPCQGQTQLVLTLREGTPVSMMVFNELGQLLFTKQSHFGAGEHVVPLQFPHVGRYWCRIQTPKGSRVQGIVVQE